MGKYIETIAHKGRNIKLIKINKGKHVKQDNLTNLSLTNLGLMRNFIIHLFKVIIDEFQQKGTFEILPILAILSFL